ncbi:unnamed protein product (macronuclear) [Paramecium tetraurelia]|uniref:TNFR-Cys domain-containing protein n=1 Tax=Paramecium tetraurelia TaxID=5888 RepID=A0CJ00_PARTE|nr:uncharacterized protein GSPATT00007902001 [Paramecium tetraurelia]CAK70767.1 unnamed protein product [Paramecium tetraurelia]|eukprot:XP_001438164.1 hypothetical protein (macronuclear) [Paramecium tetraurelia strain d4-2]
MQLIFLFFLIEVSFSWHPILSSRIIESIENENIIIEEDYQIIAEGSFSISYKGLQSYRELYLMFDAKTNKTESEILILVNGVRRNIIQVQGEFKEFHMRFQHQASDVVIQMRIDDQTKVEIRNFNMFVQECPKDCKYCLSGSCDLSLYQDCDQLRYKNTCVEECPDGTVAEFNQCVQVGLKEIEQVKSFLQEELSTIQKFGEQKLLKFNFENGFNGQLEIVFNCYSKQKQNADQLIKVGFRKGQTQVMYPFLNSYTNLQFHKECKPQYELECVQVKGLFDVEFLKQDQILIDSYSKKLEQIGYWEVESFKVYNESKKLYECDIENCSQCSYNNVCQQCQDHFHLYQGQCIKKCPFYTIQEKNRCINLHESQPDLKFLVKLESPFQDLSQIFGQITFDLKEQISFRYENQTTFIGGGLLDRWRRTTFSKQLNLGRHYAIRIMFNISLENSTQDQDSFIYSIDGKTFKVLNNQTYVDQTLNHNKNILNLNLGCKISSNGRCVVSNYYFMTMKCSPLCQSCTGPSQSDCKIFEANIDKFDYKNFKCQDGYYLSEYGCKLCSQGCQLCESQNRCLKCQDTKEAEFICKPYL